MKICDGCGTPADDKHVRERIERLEWATRFRPVHIHVLLIAWAPPARTEDYFYRPAGDRALRSSESRAFFDELLKAAGGASGAGASEEAALAEFQRQGLFLSYGVECPLETTRAATAAAASLFPTLLKRIQFSYRPKGVALISRETRALVPLLQQAGWSDRLILENGLPFQMETRPSSGDTESLGDRLAAAIRGMV